MAETLASDQVTLAKVIDGGDIPEELIEKIETASTDAAEAKTDAAQAIEDAEDAAKTASSFITTNENGAFFHPENDPTNSIRIDGDSIDFYQDEEMLAQIEQLTINGELTTSIRTNGKPSQIQMAVAEQDMEQSHVTVGGTSVGRNIEARTQLGFNTAVMHASSGLTNGYAELSAMNLYSSGTRKEALVQARVYDNDAGDPTQGATSKIRLEADEVTVNGVPIEPPINVEYSVSSFTGSTGTIASAAMGEGSFACNRAGWTPVSIAGFGTSNGSGSGSSYAIFNIMRMTNRKEGGCTISWRIRAYGGQVKTCAINVDILWMRTIQQVLP